jgi:ABC-type multidrug transport system ATPase subunit
MEAAKVHSEQNQRLLANDQRQANVRIQLNWDKVVISTNPQPGCCGKKANDLKPKVILDGVSGSVLPGQFLSIIGASGAGKTTLLNFLSGRLISQKLEKSGKVQINGVDREKIKGFQAYCAYVQQDDILFQTLTVRECLEFAAKLKLPGTYEQKMQRVEQIISELRLSKCQNTKIGGPLVKGVSGGERKRTSIGVELITDPSLIFLDEPTTGLDSFTATSVMETLRELANQGRTIVQTIHQPNSDIFEMFDRLMLLAKGRVIYYNEARFAVDYFAGIGYKCPELSNPADYFMGIMSIESIEKPDTDDKDTLEKSQRDI